MDQAPKHEYEKGMSLIVSIQRETVSLYYTAWAGKKKKDGGREQACIHVSIVYLIFLFLVKKQALLIRHFISGSDLQLEGMMVRKWFPALKLLILVLVRG